MLHNKNQIMHIYQIWIIIIIKITIININIQINNIKFNNHNNNHYHNNNIINKIINCKKQMELLILWIYISD